MSKRRHPSDPKDWLANLENLRGIKDMSMLQNATDVYQEDEKHLLEKGLGIAEILLSLGLDNETLATALIYPAFQSHRVNLDKVAELLGEEGTKLLQDIFQMRTLGDIQHFTQRGGHQVENLRKMLLAIVTDVRAILIVLAERLWHLSQAKSENVDEQQKLAQETLTIYAPLANRLGVWQLKWEIEDYCLRYIKPDIYKMIAKGLSAKRGEREEYVDAAIAMVQNVLKDAGIKNMEITGRVKHIYSIYKKMQRKRANLEDIYDMTALRVLVNSVEDCYTVLSVLQNHWMQVHEEFDDYISFPKPNGYKSIHVVLVGPESRYIEVQIRTYQMHQECELGVAAHWRYKEGVLQPSSYEAKIALLRQVIAWQKEITQNDEAQKAQASPDVFADRIYVFTPTGDIVDLPTDSTPLDFAYHIHSEVGHRCRGAKVNQHIVPLTYKLQTGERIEILTAKEANPSRDWLNPHLGYIKSSRARAKIAHWFRVQDSIQNMAQGRELLDKELKKANIAEKPDLDKIADKFNCKTGDDLLASIGAGDVRVAHIINYLKPQVQTPSTPSTPEVRVPTRLSHVEVLGMNNLLTNIAKCCKPLPGDKVIGYVTRSKGVTIHRVNCANLKHAARHETNRLLEVNWDKSANELHQVDLIIRTYDRSGLLRDITGVLATEKINVVSLHTQSITNSPEADIYMTVDIHSKTQLEQAIELIKKISNVIDIKRRK